MIPGTEIPDSAARMTGPNGVLQGEGVSPSDYTQSAFLKKRDVYDVSRHASLLAVRLAARRCERVVWPYFVDR